MTVSMSFAGSLRHFVVKNINGTSRDKSLINELLMNAELFTLTLSYADIQKASPEFYV